MSSRNVSISLALVATLAGGCARTFATGALATGEPLSFDGAIHRQGKAPVDEEDYFRIAGAPDLADQIARRRARGLTYNRIGLALVAVGVAGLVATVEGDGAVRRAGEGVVLALPIGGVTAYYGKLTAERYPSVSWRVTQEVTDRYDAHLGGPGVAP